MNFNIIYTPEARLDLRNITEYISNKLLVPDTARKQAARIMNGIQGWLSCHIGIASITASHGSRRV